MFVVSHSLSAQGSLGEMRRQASRGELEQIATATENAAAAAPDEKTREKLLSDATALRQRLQNGDFIPGDRILLTVVTDSVLSDTFTVRSDRMLQLPNLPDISLHGVLDSELTPYLTTSLSRYIKHPEVTAKVLLRVAVLGAVGKPGYLTIPADQALTDVLMLAGGPTGTAVLDKSVVQRKGSTILDRSAVQEAFRTGKTVGDVSMRDGDILFIPDKTSGLSWTQVTGALGAVVGIFWAIRYGLGRGHP